MERENEFETKQAKARAIMEKLNEANVKKVSALNVHKLITSILI